MLLVHPFSSSAQCLICTPVSELLKIRRTWDSPLTNLHKSSAHFTSRWFGSITTQPFYFCSRQQLGRKSCPEVFFTVDVHPSITHRCKSDEHRAKPNKDAINQRKNWKCSSRYRGFYSLHNCYLFGIVNQGQSVILPNTCIRRLKRGIRRQGLLSGLCTERKNTNNWWCFCCFNPDSDSFRSGSVKYSCLYAWPPIVSCKSIHIPWIHMLFLNLWPTKPNAF